MYPSKAVIPEKLSLLKARQLSQTSKQLAHSLTFRVGVYTLRFWYPRGRYLRAVLIIQLTAAIFVVLRSDRQVPVLPGFAFLVYMFCIQDLCCEK